MKQVLTGLLVVMAAPAVAQTAADKPADGDKVVCKREVPVGSLIASRKVCLTKAQWIERSTRGNEEARRQMDENAARNATPSN